MIYLVKKICTNCNMKIELMDGHFGEKLECPNCDSDISVPDLNKFAEEKERLNKQIEELKNDSNFTQTNTITMGRPGGTIKVNAASGASPSDELRKLKEVNEKLRKDSELLTGKLKGLQAANMAMNDQLTSLKAQKEEFSKSLETVKDLQRRLDEKNKEAQQLKDKLEKYSAITQNLKDISTVGSEPVVSHDDMAETMLAPAPDLDETLEVPKDSFEDIQKVNFDETLQITMEAVKGSGRECSSCEADYPLSAKFCPKCGTKNDRYSD